MRFSYQAQVRDAPSESPIPKRAQLCASTDGRCFLTSFGGFTYLFVDRRRKHGELSLPYILFLICIVR